MACATLQPTHVPPGDPAATGSRPLGLGVLEVGADAHRPGDVDDVCRGREEPGRERVVAVGKLVVEEEGLEGGDGYPLGVDGVEAGDGVADDEQVLGEPVVVLVAVPAAARDRIPVD